MFAKMAWLGAAGALGALARYGLSGVVQKACNAEFPWGTWAVNIAGCFLIGFVWTLAEERALISPQVRLIVLTGFMGAFTTFSTYIFETGQMVRDSQWLWAGANLVGQNVVGLGLLYLGMLAARLS